MSFGRNRVVRRSALKPQPQNAACANCKTAKRSARDLRCPHANHYTAYDRCVVVEHGCPGFKSLDVSEEDRKIRAEERKRFYGSRHERLTITDLLRMIERGEGRFMGPIRRQVDFPLVIAGEKFESYRADAVVFDKEDGHEVALDPKGIAFPMFRIKRKLMRICHPNVEVIEVRE